MFFNIFNAKGYSPLHKSPLSPQLRGGEAVDTRGLHSPLPVPQPSSVAHLCAHAGRYSCLQCFRIWTVQKAEVAPTGLKRGLIQLRLNKHDLSCWVRMLQAL